MNDSGDDDDDDDDDDDGDDDDDDDDMDILIPHNISVTSPYRPVQVM